ncbi:MAG: RNA polymerase sigma factor [Anaerolineae bacterium]|nr:RNA polymerase sigma factor [Anaerolineae bacterium]
MTASLPRFETLIERHHDEIYAYLWRLLDGTTQLDQPADTEDLAQEVFLRAYKAYPRLRANSNARAWLYKIATNCAYTLLKRSRRRPFDVPLWDETDEPAADEPSPDDLASLGESVGVLREAVVTLPPQQQAALLMRYIQGLEYAEVAQALGSSEEAARANVYQAIRRLRREMNSE